MKLLAGAVLALTFAQGVMANDQNHNSPPPTSHYWRCEAVDSAGRSYRANLQWSDDRTDFVQRQALARCHAESPRPNSCRPAGCQIYN